jgi:hypothetical protein
LFRLLEEAVGAASSVTDQYAIGGAVGMAVHGYARQTSDVDLFIDDSARTVVLLLHELKRRGFYVMPLPDGPHYIARLSDERNADAFILVTLAMDDIDWSAVTAPDQATMGDLSFQVFPPELLVLSKFYSVDNPQYLADIYKMFHRAAFDPTLARKYLAEMDPEKVSEWDAMISSIERPRLPSQKPKRRKPA